MWSNPFSNFLDIFFSLKKDLIGSNIKVLFNGEFINNRNVPESYLITWIFASSPIITIVFFLLGYLSYAKRFIIRFINIKEKNIFNDLWRGCNEQKDFIFFFILTSFYLTLLVFNAPFYNGWRLVYFLNIFIIYFGVYQVNNCINLFNKKIFIKKLVFFLVVCSILHNVISLIVYHPYQSYYFSELISDNKKNNFEGDYYGISGKHFFLKLIAENKERKMRIAVASHTPLHRGLESLDVNLRERFEVIGQNYKNADFIYKNNISEVNSNLNKKYNIPMNFVKTYELNINGVKVYEIYKNKNTK